MATAPLTALLCCVSLALADHTAVHDLAQSNIVFANKVYQALVKIDKNVVFSPLVLQSSLAAVYRGARGKTAQQLQDVLNLNAKHLERMPQGFQETLTSVRKEPRLRLASGLFVDKTVNVLPDFQRSTRRNFLTEVLPLDFSNGPEVAINQWVQKKTDHNINSIAKPGSMSASNRLVLGSAAHYDAKWRDAPGSPVTGPKNSTINLHYSGRVLIGDFHEQNYMVIQIPYKLTPESPKEDALRLNIIVPKDAPDAVEKLPSYIEKINFETLEEEMYATKTQLLVSNLDLERSYSLKSILKEMGIVDLFDEKASDLKGISDAPLKVDDVIHSASIKMTDDRDASTEVDPFEDENKNVQMALYAYGFVLQDPKSKAIVLMGNRGVSSDE